MRNLTYAVILTACSGDPFTAGPVETPDAALPLTADASPPAPCDEGPLCAPCSAPDRGGPIPGECVDLAAAVGDPRHVQCIGGRCSFQCANSEIAPGLCDAFESRCTFPPSDPTAQVPFCLK